MKKYTVKIEKDLGFLIEGRVIVEAASLKKARKYISESFPGYTILSIKVCTSNDFEN